MFTEQIKKMMRFCLQTELLRLTGCKNMDELLAYTGNSFCNLIRPDEQESCQKSIWSQINGGHSNDYIFFHM